MHIVGAKLDEATAIVWGYDPINDPDWELCAVFSAIPEEEKVQLITRYRRNHHDTDNCQILSEFSKEDFDVFEKIVPKFYDAAMTIFNFSPFDDSFPITQKEFPFQKSPHL